MAWSGGSEPGIEINPAAVAAMTERGIDIGGEFLKPWTDETVRAADVVITMGCGDACPICPGKRYEDWRPEARRPGRPPAPTRLHGVGEPVHGLEECRRRRGPAGRRDPPSAADNFWLSPSNLTDTVCLHFTWIGDEAAIAPVVAAIERRLAAFDARPHWGKRFTVPPTEIARLYPRLDDFRALMTSFDPVGKFRNQMIQTLIPG